MTICFRSGLILGSLPSVNELSALLRYFRRSGGAVVFRDELRLLVIGGWRGSVGGSNGLAFSGVREIRQCQSWIGTYNSASEVVRESLRLIKEYDSARAAQLAESNGEI